VFLLYTRYIFLSERRFLYNYDTSVVISYRLTCKSFPILQSQKKNYRYCKADDAVLDLASATGYPLKEIHKVVTSETAQLNAVRRGRSEDVRAEGRI